MCDLLNGNLFLLTKSCRYFGNLLLLTKSLFGGLLIGCEFHNRSSMDLYTVVLVMELVFLTRVGFSCSKANAICSSCGFPLPICRVRPIFRFIRWHRVNSANWQKKSWKNTSSLRKCGARSSSASSCDGTHWSADDRWKRLYHEKTICVACHPWILAERYWRKGHH